MLLIVLSTWEANSIGRDKDDRIGTEEIMIHYGLLSRHLSGESQENHESNPCLYQYPDKVPSGSFPLPERLHLWTTVNIGLYYRPFLHAVVTACYGLKMNVDSWTQRSFVFNLLIWSYCSFYAVHTNQAKREINTVFWISLCVIHYIYVKIFVHLFHIGCSM